jgi:hypothetical protein
MNTKFGLKLEAGSRTSICTWGCTRREKVGRIRSNHSLTAWNPMKKQVELEWMMRKIFSICWFYGLSRWFWWVAYYGMSKWESETKAAQQVFTNKPQSMKSQFGSVTWWRESNWTIMFWPMMSRVPMRVFDFHFSIHSSSSLHFHSSSPSTLWFEFLSHF